MPSHGCAGAAVHHFIKCTTTEPSWLPCFHRARDFQGSHRQSYTSSQWPEGLPACRLNWHSHESAPGISAALCLQEFQRSQHTPAVCLVNLTAGSGLTFKVYIYIFRWPESKAEILLHSSDAPLQIHNQDYPIQLTYWLYYKA